MANNTLKTRIVLNNKTNEEWNSATYSNTVPLKGEVCIYSDVRKIKIGDGTTKIGELLFANLTPEEVTALVKASSHTHSNKNVLDATTASFTTDLLNKLNGIASGANKITVDTTLSSTSTNPVQNKVVNSALNNKVPTSRTVNGKALSTNISLNAADVGADVSGAADTALASAKTYSDTNLGTAKSYADTKIANLINGAPETMDTLKEVSDAIDANKDVVTALNAAIGNKVDKISGKTLSTNDYTTSEKNKLAGIATGAEVNQNAFSKITVGDTTIEADSKTDTLTMVAGTNVTITPDATNDKVTITAKDTTYSAAGTDLGLVKSGGDVTISNGVVTVNDDSHNHVISNVDGLQAALDGKAATSHGTHVTYSTAAPAANGTASAGKAATVSRSDHVHPLQTTVSGNAGSATKLATARTVALSGGVVGTATSFDGTADISIPVTSVNAAMLTLDSSDTLILDGSI